MNKKKKNNWECKKGIGKTCLIFQASFLVISPNFILLWFFFCTLFNCSDS